jgi:hypothetical protein
MAPSATRIVGKSCSTNIHITITPEAHYYLFSAQQLQNKTKNSQGKCCRTGDHRTRSIGILSQKTEFALVELGTITKYSSQVVIKYWRMESSIVRSKKSIQVSNEVIALMYDIRDSSLCD